MKLNFKKLRMDLQSISNEIRFIRANGRRSPAEIRQEVLFQEWRLSGYKDKAVEESYRKACAEAQEHTLQALKEKATILCSIRANHHNRLHRKKIRNPYSTLPDQPLLLELTPKDQEALIAQHLAKYLQEDPETQQ